MKTGLKKKLLPLASRFKITLNYLQSNLVTFNKTNFNNVYRTLIVKQITLYFTVESDKIVLLRFWNNYQDLSTFKLE